jgi:hypothetical protein
MRIYATISIIYCERMHLCTNSAPLRPAFDDLLSVVLKVRLHRAVPRVTEPAPGGTRDRRETAAAAPTPLASQGWSRHWGTRRARQRGRMGRRPRSRYRIRRSSSKASKADPAAQRGGRSIWTRRYGPCGLFEALSNPQTVARANTQPNHDVLKVVIGGTLG